MGSISSPFSKAYISISNIVAKPSGARVNADELWSFPSTAAVAATLATSVRQKKSGLRGSGSSASMFYHTLTPSAIDGPVNHL